MITYPPTLTLEQIPENRTVCAFDDLVFRKPLGEVQRRLEGVLRTFKTANAVIVHPSGASKIAAILTVYREWTLSLYVCKDVPEKEVWLCENHNSTPDEDASRDP